MAYIRLKEVERARAYIDHKQAKEIRDFYLEVLHKAEEWEDRVLRNMRLTNMTSTAMRTQYLQEMQRDLNAEISKLGVSLNNSVKKNMLDVAASVVDGQNWLLNSIGVKINTAYSFIPEQVVNSLVTGEVYEGNWSLSKAIWNLTGKNKEDIQRILAQGAALNKSSYEIAKDIEKYVNPAARKDWDWDKVYPGTNKVVDYSAQRLARTMISHAYQQSFVTSTKENPFVEGYKWLIANNHKVCDICIGYAEDVHAPGLPEGVFLKDDLPMDHPNGQCTFAIYMPDSTDQITDRLIDWVKGTEDQELDRFANSLGYPIQTVKSSVVEKRK